MATHSINHQTVPGENYDFSVVKMQNNIEVKRSVENGSAKSAPTTSKTPVSGGEPSKEKIIKDQNRAAIFPRIVTLRRQRSLGIHLTPNFKEVPKLEVLNFKP